MPHLLSYMVAETMGANILSEGIIRNNRCKAVGKCLGMGRIARTSRVVVMTTRLCFPISTHSM